MANILITGGTGILGKSLSQLLTSKNIPFTIASRTNKTNAAHITVVDLLTGKGIVEAAKDKDIIFHLATDIKNDLLVTQNLLKAIQPGTHLIYISVVGIENVPFAYYQQKVASENAIKQSGIPFTILRATQFHEFVNKIIGTFLKYPVGLLPKRLVIQPIETTVVAGWLYKLSLEAPTGKTYEIGGPEILTLRQMANAWQRQTGKKRWIINLPVWGALGRAFNYGSLTTMSRVENSMSWQQWLEKQYPVATTIENKQLATV